ncbi:MAG: hypothetical protein WB564_01020 [Dehalococcoidia bacterium]
MRREVRKIAVKRLMKDEKGQALVLVLLLLLIGSLIVTPTLNFMSTGVIGGRVYEQKNDEIYAADAGVEDALWHIRNDTIKDLLGAGYDEYNYSTTYSYPYNLLVNGKNVTVTIQNVWIPKDIPNPPPPSPSTARQIIQDENLLIVGYPSSNTSTYEIKIDYNWDTTAHREALKVKTIGVWLSPGFEYTEYSGSCSLQGQSFYSAPTVSLYKGGQAVVWNFASQPYLKNFPTPATGSTPPLEKTFTFKYTSPEAGQIPELLASWIDTTGVTGITYTWDDSIRLYRIVSIAGGVRVEAYGAKTKFRKLKSTISSDYTVAGNTLLIATGSGKLFGCSYPESYYRNRLSAESSSTITRIPLQSIPPSGIVPPEQIPQDATISNVYLYWSGWIDPHYYYYSYGYRWGEISALQYPSSPTPANLKTLIEGAKVNKVKFAVDSNAQTVTCNNTAGDSKWQIISTYDCTAGSNSWAYSCWKDVTNLVVSGNVTVQKYIENAMKSNGSGTVTFTAGHAAEVRGVKRTGTGADTYYFPLYNIGQSTGYPLGTPAHKLPSGETCYQERYQWACAGWSLIIFYSTPALMQRQLYLYDDFRYRSYLGGGDDPTFSVGGFLAPPVISANDTSHLTYFVGEGDDHYSGDSIKVNNMYLSDANDPQNNVFNSFSNALLPLTTPVNTDGEDVDTFVLPSNCIPPYATSATVTLDTNQEIYFLVYLVLSFRSELTTGGIITSVKIS